MDVCNFRKGLTRVEAQGAYCTFCDRTVVAVVEIKPGSFACRQCLQALDGYVELRIWAQAASNHCGPCKFASRGPAHWCLLFGAGLSVDAAQHDLIRLRECKDSEV